VRIFDLLVVLSVLKVTYRFFLIIQSCFKISNLEFCFKSIFRVDCTRFTEITCCWLLYLHFINRVVDFFKQNVSVLVTYLAIMELVLNEFDQVV